MKIYPYLLLLVATSALGQPVIQQGTPSFTIHSGVAAEPPKLTKFNLDFPGGTPVQLVAAIEKASARPLNVVIPDEYANENIPALKMTQITASDLFRGLEMASLKTEAYRSSAYYGGGNPSYQQLQTTLSFQTTGPQTDDSIWYFRGRQKPPDFSAWDAKPAPARICRFYSLNPYLEQGIKVEDITTAIQTGWKMLGEKETPAISFHKETKLLIAVGEPGKLETIDSVLNALRPGSQPNSFSERLSMIQRSPPPPAGPKTNAATPKATAPPESEP